MHTKFKKAFLDDGTVSAAEKKKLDALEKQINIILEYIDALKSPNAKLDKLYEIVIESHKKVTTNPDLFNKKQYQNALEQFSAAYNTAPAGLKKLWKKAAAKSKEDFKLAKQKLAEASATQQAVNQLEQQACASIYCIIRGKDAAGKDWYRIDYVGANYREGYVEQPQEGRLNDIPLLVRYYTYENGSYNFIKDSSKLETAQDKQLMDAFL